MEWVLQLVDEIDDAIAVVRHSCLGLHARFAALRATAEVVATPAETAT